MHRTLFLVLAVAACSGGESARAAQSAPQAAAGRSRATTATRDTATRPLPVDSQAFRALYVNRFAAQSSKRMAKLIAIADSTEINALVIDFKDEFGLNYEPTDPAVVRNAGHSGHIPHLRALLDTLRAHKILTVARIVVFKDSVAANANPDMTIRKADGSTWRDKKGLAWVDPYNEKVWEYNLKVAEDAVRLGFAEVQFDYIRFPEPYKSLPQQVFPAAKGRAKPETLAQFLSTARSRLHALGARSTADIFGLVTTVKGALEVGQEWEKLAPVTDVLLPMVYPSHYPTGSFGIAHPNADPYRTVLIAISKAHERDDKLGITTPEHVRPWLQAFTLGSPHYGAAEVVAQRRAVYDSGYDGWVLWNPGSNYDPYLSALEKRFVSHKKPFHAAGKVASE